MEQQNQQEVLETSKLADAKNVGVDEAVNSLDDGKKPEYGENWIDKNILENTQKIVEFTMQNSEPNFSAGQDFYESVYTINKNGISGEIKVSIADIEKNGKFDIDKDDLFIDANYISKEGDKVFYTEEGFANGHTVNKVIYNCIEKDGQLYINKNEPVEKIGPYFGYETPTFDGAKEIKNNVESFLSNSQYNETRTKEDLEQSKKYKNGFVDIGGKVMSTDEFNELQNKK